jgi:hypothetical protein
VLSANAITSGSEVSGVPAPGAAAVSSPPEVTGVPVLEANAVSSPPVVTGVPFSSEVVEVSSIGLTFPFLSIPFLFLKALAVLKQARPLTILRMLSTAGYC